ncbi:Nephrin [Eumeta japonica]|uniref:Nephrin n=1 Tax=Eumeta variegata TaxID=151549 RepID=A0A4C1XCF6_EUMVA|nr:Nephrin [Eumeta japonica]
MYPGRTFSFPPDPPSAPLITGYVPGTVLAAGTVQKLACISTGGNPLATLIWYKNDKKIHSVTKTTEKSVSSEISILTNVTDNQAQYRCEATNSATEIPLFETVTLNVHFAPEAVKVRAEPDVLKPEVEATLYCDGASSNPPALLSWWRDGIPVQGSPVTTKKGLHGGTVSTIQLKLNITKDLNGARYTCQATNEALQRSVHDALELKVLYPPKFDESTLSNAVGVENEPLVIVVRAEGNPSSITYTWTKDGLPITQSSYSNSNERILSEGGMLNITRLSRHDAGVYTCEAVNSQGSAMINITVSVHYPASIKSVSQNGITNPNEDAVLSCTAIGNPLTADHIKWERRGYDIESKKTTFDPKNLTSYLQLDSVSKDDVGNFQCVVNNGIGDESRKDIMLIVKFKPDMMVSPYSAKFASNVGQDGRLTCKCKSVPAPNFAWYKNSIKLPVNTSSKYYAEYHKIDPITYTSTLIVKEVATNDYGPYKCEARNDLGFADTTLNLDITSAPDQVTTLSVSNVTHNSVTLQWIPGFDGGMPTSYRIRYRKMYEETYKYEDVTPKSATSYTVIGLEKNTDYLFSIMALNKLGQSKYRPDDTKATTHRHVKPLVADSFTASAMTSLSCPQTTLRQFDELKVPALRPELRGSISGPCLFVASTEVDALNVVPTEYVDSADVSRGVALYASITGAVLVLVNAALVACFLLKRRARRLKEQAGQASKSATIEMYAPSSYNDTMTGETLSSVSEKSETYSAEDAADDRPPPPIPEVPTMPSRHMLSQLSPLTGLRPSTDRVIPQQTDAYMLEDPALIIPPPLDYPPPNYTPGEHARTLPHPHRQRDAPGHGTLGRVSGKQSYAPAPSPMPPLDGSYYNMASDRYLSYPPLINDYMHHNQTGRTPTPPHQYAGGPLSKPQLMNGMLPSSPAPAHASPPHSYGLDGMPLERQSTGGTLRRRLDKAGPPPDVTVLHPGCTQHPQSPQPAPVKQPQSILKDPSRQKYQTQYGSPVASGAPHNSSQILTVQNLAADVPQYGTIRKEKKQNVTIDESYNKRSHFYFVYKSLRHEIQKVAPRDCETKRFTSSPPANSRGYWTPVTSARISIDSSFAQACPRTEPWPASNFAVSSIDANRRWRCDRVQ